MGSSAALVLLVALAVTATAPWFPVGARRGRGDRDRRRRREPPAVVDDAVVLDMVAAALASGASVLDAVAAVGGALPDAQARAYVRADRALRVGSSWEQAWPDGGPVADALGPAWRDGVDPEPLLQHAASTIRQRRRARAREAAARLGVRLVLPLGLCLLPAFVLLGLVPVLIAAGLDLWGG